MYRKPAGNKEHRQRTWHDEILAEEAPPLAQPSLGQSRRNIAILIGFSLLGCMGWAGSYVFEKAKKDDQASAEVKKVKKEPLPKVTPRDIEVKDSYIFFNHLKSRQLDIRQDQMGGAEIPPIGSGTKIKAIIEGLEPQKKTTLQAAPVSTATNERTDERPITFQLATFTRKEDAERMNTKYASALGSKIEPKTMENGKVLYRVRIN